MSILHSASAVAAGNGFSSNPLWYVTRSTAVVAFVLLTAGTVLGVAATQRTLASPSWPRFATQGVHRNVNLLGLAFVVVHVVTTLADGYVNIAVPAVLIPFVSQYRTLAVAAGTLSFDLFLAVSVTGLIRLRMTERWWRAVHLTSYLAWPLAWAHFVFTGTDGSFARWGFWLGLLCAGLVLAAGVVRLRTRTAGPQGPIGSVRRRPGPARP